MVWVPHLQPSALKVAEAKSKTPTELARALFVEIFKKELSERPDKVNCTETLDGKELLNQQFIRGIRCKYFVEVYTYLHLLNTEWQPHSWLAGGTRWYGKLTVQNPAPGLSLTLQIPGQTQLLALFKCSP